MLEKTLENLLDSKAIKPANSKINPEYSLEGLMLKLILPWADHVTAGQLALPQASLSSPRNGRRLLCIPQQCGGAESEGLRRKHSDPQSLHRKRLPVL